MFSIKLPSGHKIHIILISVKHADSSLFFGSIEAQSRSID